ncbi:hypothetical protein FRX31_009947 [Thalictrum thalictroides]|uniref:Uncharacterized protein n=1 Tax=Thalictrum thalictroides TaxID=46969 RepID=A0A7J6WVF3_THATH|nr:hypothetical protein FRX31_009947 [Thalictrum thalictroides]
MMDSVEANEKEEGWQSPKRRHTCHQGAIETGTSVVVVASNEKEWGRAQTLTLDRVKPGIEITKGNEGRQNQHTKGSMAAKTTQGKGGLVQASGGSSKHVVGASTHTLNSKKVIR